MEVNQAVYGAPETWERDEVFTYMSVTPAAYQFKRGQYTTLQEYNEHSLNTIGSDIDSSICYAGMAKGLPLTKMRAFLLDYDGSYSMKIYQMDRETGWYFGDLNSSYTHDNDCLIVGGDLLKNVTPPSSYIKNQYWKPDGNIRTYPEQPSCRIIPIVEFNTKGCYFGVKVKIFKQSDGTTQDVWLDSLHSGSWSGWVIVRAWLEMYTYRQSPTDFTAINNSSNHRGAISPIADYEFNFSGLESMHFQQYALLYSSIPLYGWITNEATTITVDGVKHFSARSLYSNSAEVVTAQVFVDTLESTYNTGDYTSWGMYAEGYAAITAENLERLRECAAAYGLFFTEKNPSTFETNADRWTDENMFCGLLDNGIGKGAYTRGQGNTENPVFDMGSSQNSPYVPSAPFDPNIYSNVTSFNSLETNASLLKYYVLDKTNVEILGDDLWTICDTLSADDYDNFDGKIKDEFLTTNPIDSIISLVRYPFNVPHIFSNTKTAIQLGKSTGQAQGYRTYNITFGVDFEGVDIYPRFGDSFLDYAPYTKYELYIPFCGTVEINPGDILGHKLNLKLRVDLSTGSVIAYIMADYLVIGTAKGSCGAEQVLNGTQSATVNSNIINGLITYDAVNEQRMNQFGKAVYPTGLIKDVLDPFGTKQAFESLDIQQEQAEFNLTHIATPVHKMGAPSPLLAWLQEFNARLMIYYPEGDVISNTIPPDLIPAAISSFGHIKGFATATPGKVSSFQTRSRQNYLRGNILADSIPCTANERSRIRALFSDGVYLPLLTT